MRAPIEPDMLWTQTLAVYARSRVFHRWIPTLIGDDGSAIEVGQHPIHLGVIVRPHRLFAIGDVCIVEITNGAAERACAWCHTGRGYAVDHHYLRFQGWRSTSLTKFRRPGMALGPHRLGIRMWRESAEVWARRSRPNGCLMASRGESRRMQAGPLHILFDELPRDLVGLRPDDAAVRRYVVGTLRAGDAAPRVGSSSPRPFSEST